MPIVPTAVFATTSSSSHLFLLEDNFRRMSGSATYCGLRVIVENLPSFTASGGTILTYTGFRFVLSRRSRARLYPGECQLLFKSPLTTTVHMHPLEFLPPGLEVSWHSVSSMHIKDESHYSHEQ